MLIMTCCHLLQLASWAACPHEAWPGMPEPACQAGQLALMSRGPHRHRSTASVKPALHMKHHKLGHTCAALDTGKVGAQVRDKVLQSVNVRFCRSCSSFCGLQGFAHLGSLHGLTA